MSIHIGMYLHRYTYRYVYTYTGAPYLLRYPTMYIHMPMYMMCDRHCLGKSGFLTIFFLWDTGRRRRHSAFLGMNQSVTNDISLDRGTKGRIQGIISAPVAQRGEHERGDLTRSVSPVRAVLRDRCLLLSLYSSCSTHSNDGYNLHI